MLINSVGELHRDTVPVPPSDVNSDPVPVAVDPLIPKRKVKF
jgi:hypothetical protein